MAEATIVVVDDDRDTCEMIEAMLTDAGYQPILASDFEACPGYQFHPQHRQPVLASFSFLHDVEHSPATISRWYREHR